jgi:hypothetical protein
MYKAECLPCNLYFLVLNYSEFAILRIPAIPDTYGYFGDADPSIRSYGSVYTVDNFGLPQLM